MFTIKNMIPQLTGTSINVAIVEAQPYDAYQCDSFTLMLDPVAELGSKKVLQLRDKENVAKHSVPVYEKCFIMNDNGKTIDTIYA